MNRKIKFALFLTQVAKCPVLLPDICGVLLRFRKFTNAICADVKSAFHQVLLKENQRDLTRFLWLKNAKDPPTYNKIEKWRFVGMPFGVIAAPFLLGAVISYHLENLNLPFGDELKRGLYADNVFFEAYNEGEAAQKCKTAIRIFDEAKMVLHEFCSNLPNVNRKFGDKGQTNPTKILGLFWDTEKDAIIIELKEIKIEEKLTKRKILKAVASTFDPLGIIAPANLQRKLFFQSLWKHPELGWDDPIGAELLEKFNELRQEKGKFTIKRKTIKTIVCLQNYIFSLTPVEKLLAPLHIFARWEAWAQTHQYFFRKGG